MRILVLNTGSSSVKFAVVNADERSGNTQQSRLVTGSLQGIGGQASLAFIVDGHRQSVAEAVTNHREALDRILKHLATLPAQHGVTAGVKEKARSSLLSSVEAVGHRIVHGGDRFQTAVRIDDTVLAEIEQLTELAPLHNPAGVAGIRAAQAALGSSLPHVAVFDTAFHHAMPAQASTYAIGQDLAVRHKIRRYGFHGIAHASLVAGYAAHVGARPEDLRLVVFHLGSGCSAAAVRGGRSIDTSMGFTPLEGLVMSTRSGDLDPAIVAYLVRREGMAAEEVERWLNERSGLLGMSARSKDINDLLSAAEQEGDKRSALAIDVFCYRARKYLGAYLAALGGADAVVFGGGIGEHVPAVRAWICAGMEWCGLTIEKDRNAQAVGISAGTAACISPDSAALPAFVVPADEESWIARETVACLSETTRR